MVKPLIVGNWKGYVSTLKGAKKLFKDIEKKLPRTNAAQVVVCPPHPFLQPLRAAYRGTRIMFGAQDAYFENGAYTGETTATMVRDVGVSYVLLGHAEKRTQGETDAIVAKKVGAALDNGLTPIVCVGESTRDHEGHYLEELGSSILESLALVDEKSFKKIIIAYEPIWAKGAPLPPSARTIRESIIFIRKTLAQKFDRSDALKAKILYGNAVNDESIAELMNEGGADGFLIARASVDAEEFVSVIQKVSAYI